MSLLLLETGDQLLQENGDALLLDGGSSAFMVTLDGEDIIDAIRLGEQFITPELDFQRGQPGSFRFDLEIATKPARGLEVIAWNKTGTSRSFGGVVENAVPIVMPPGVPKCYRVEALKFDRYFDYFYWSKKYESAVTPLQILRDLWADKDLEAEYGLVLDETVAEGDPITALPLEWVNAKGAQVIKDIEDYCVTAGDPRVGVTSALKVFSLLTPGSVPAPVTLSTALMNYSDIRPNPSKRPQANTVIGEFGTPGEGAEYVRYTWPTCVGGETVFSLDGKSMHATATPPGVIRVDGVDTPMSLPDAPPGPNDIEWDYTLDGGSAIFHGTSAALISAGSIVSLNYQPKFPFTVEETNGGTPRIEVLIKDTSVEHWAQGVTKAQAALAQLDQDPDVFEIDTLEDGIDMYQLLPFDIPEADADDSEGIVTGVRALLYSADPDDPADGSYWEYTVTVEKTDGQPLQPDTIARHRLALRSVI